MLQTNDSNGSTLRAQLLRLVWRSSLRIGMFEERTLCVIETEADTSHLYLEFDFYYD
jgi:hypothetical protein